MSVGCASHSAFVSMSKWKGGPVTGRLMTIRDPTVMLVIAVACRPKAVDLNATKVR